MDSFRIEYLVFYPLLTELPYKTKKPLQTAYCCLQGLLLQSISYVLSSLMETGSVFTRKTKYKI